MDTSMTMPQLSANSTSRPPMTSSSDPPTIVEKNLPNEECDHEVEEDENDNENDSHKGNNNDGDEDEDHEDNDDLSSVAKDFTQLLQASSKHQMELPQIASKLNISQSTVEDVSSILEGVGYIRRLPSGVVELLSGAAAAGNDTIQGNDVRLLQARLDQVVEEDATLDTWIYQLNGSRSAAATAVAASSPTPPSYYYTVPPSTMAAQRYNYASNPWTSAVRWTPERSSRLSTTASPSTTSHILGTSKPVRLDCSSSNNRIALVSSEDTEESTPSSLRSEPHSSPPSSYTTTTSRFDRPHPLSPVATMRNAKTRVLLLDSSMERKDMAQTASSSSVSNTNKNDAADETDAVASTSSHSSTKTTSAMNTTSTTLKIANGNDENKLRIPSNEHDEDGARKRLSFDLTDEKVLCDDIRKKQKTSE